MSTLDSKRNPDCSTKQLPSSRSANPAGRKLWRRAVSQTYWAQEQIEIDSGVGRSARMKLLEQHGNFSLAYSTAVQPKLKHFGDDRGYIAFRKRWGMTFALGDVVASDSNREQLLDDFIRTHRRVAFCQISRSLAELLSNRGFYVNEMGLDTTLELPEYSLAGKHKEWLRYAANWTSRRNFQIIESGCEEVGPAQVESVSEAWRKTRTVKRKEVRFLNRPIVMRAEQDVRKFFLMSPEGQLLAFVFLDPIYKSGKVTGYVTVVKRRHPDAPQYAEQAIMKHVIETLKSEGVGKLMLGLSPLAGIDDSEFKHNRTTRWTFQRLFELAWVNRYFYNVVGHAKYKQRFRGREEKVYFASPSKFNSPRLLALVGLCGVA